MATSKYLFLASLWLLNHSLLQAQLGDDDDPSGCPSSNRSPYFDYPIVDTSDEFGIPEIYSSDDSSAEQEEDWDGDLVSNATEPDLRFDMPTVMPLSVPPSYGGSDGNLLCMPPLAFNALAGLIPNPTEPVSGEIIYSELPFNSEYLDPVTIDLSDLVDAEIEFSEIQTVFPTTEEAQSQESVGEKRKRTCKTKKSRSQRRRVDIQKKKNVEDRRKKKELVKSTILSVLSTSVGTKTPQLLITIQTRLQAEHQIEMKTCAIRRRLDIETGKSQDNAERLKNAEDLAVELQDITETQLEELRDKYKLQRDRRSELVRLIVLKRWSDQKIKSVSDTNRSELISKMIKHDYEGNLSASVRSIFDKRCTQSGIHSRQRSNRKNTVEQKFRRKLEKAEEHAVGLKDITETQRGTLQTNNDSKKRRSELFRLIISYRFYKYKEEDPSADERTIAERIFGYINGAYSGFLQVRYCAVSKYIEKIGTHD